MFFSFFFTLDFVLSNARKLNEKAINRFLSLHNICFSYFWMVGKQLIKCCIRWRTLISCVRNRFILFSIFYFKQITNYFQLLLLIFLFFFDENFLQFFSIFTVNWFWKSGLISVSFWNQIDKFFSISHNRIFFSPSITMSGHRHSFMNVR